MLIWIGVRVEVKEEIREERKGKERKGEEMEMCRDGRFDG